MPTKYKMKIFQFYKFVIAARKKLCGECGQIGNMFVVAHLSVLHWMRLCMLKVLIRHITASGLEKTYYIVVVTHCTDGTQLLLLLIFKRKIMSSDKILWGIYIHILAKEWMEESKMKVWLEKGQSGWVALWKVIPFNMWPFQVTWREVKGRMVKELEDMISCDCRSPYQSLATIWNLS
jgi:hypothetical protein